MERADVVIIGAGLAGLSCGFELAERGREVVLLEARDVVGGRAASWVEDGMPVESGLHRFIGYYEALPELLRKAGVELDNVVCWVDELEIRLPDGGPKGVFGASPLHKPLKSVAGVLANNELLSPLDKASLGRFLAAGLRDYVAKPKELDRRSVAQYAREQGVRERAIERLLVPLTAGIFFLPPERYSAYALFGLLAPGIPRLYQLRVGSFMGGMTEVMAAPIASAIEGRGGHIRTGARVERLLVEGGRVVGVEAAGEEIRANHVVLASSLGPAQELLRVPFSAHEWFAPMLRLPSMPAVTVQLELDEPSMPVDRTPFGPGTVLASFAEQSRTTFRHVPGRLSIILSPPERFVGMEPERVLAAACEDARRLGIDLNGHVTDYRVVSHPADFYSLVPGHEALRPEQRTPVEGLTLAGDYTRQRFLASMEGAVISGRRAARVVQHISRGTRPP